MSNTVRAERGIGKPACRTLLSTSLSDWDRSAWDDFVAATPAASLYHGSVFRDIIHESFGHRTYYLSAQDDRGVRGVLPLVRLRSLLFGDFLVSLPFFNYGGAVADLVGVRSLLEERAQTLALDLGASHVEFRDREPRGDATPVRRDKIALRRALPASEDELWHSLGSKLRAQVRRPLREGARVDIGSGELVGPFYRVFSRNMRDLGTPVYARTLFDSVCRHLGPAARIVVVNLNGRPAAAGLLLRHRDCLELPWASSLREVNPLGVNMLLYWECLALAIRQGCRQFDFGRSTEGSGSDRFKRQWGAAPEPLYWHYWIRDGRSIPALSPDNPRFRLAVSAWRRLPLPIANRLGPPLVRNLP